MATDQRRSGQLPFIVTDMRRPGFEPGLPDWQSDVLDQTGRPSHLTRFMKDSLTTFRCLEIEKMYRGILVQSCT